MVRNSVGGSEASIPQVNRAREVEAQRCKGET
jgi:hypothetical protein